jgi:ABC-2 type transport system ATP-binding protein
MSVEVINITKRYGEQLALNDVSFSLNTGEVVGFLGPNGAGKSTMMKILTGFIPANSGQARICGIDVAQAPLEVRKQIGYLPENNPLYTDMYVYEFLMFVAALYRVPARKKVVDNMVEKVGIGHESHKKIGQLSKGYRQRVGLAQALMHQPKVLILDEPTTGLDPNQIDEIRALIKEVGLNCTVLMSTHIMQEVEAICGRVLIINKGQLVADAPVDEIRSWGNDDVVIEVEFDGAVDPELLCKVEGVKHMDAISPNKFRLYCKSDNRLMLQQFAMSNGHLIITLKKDESRLEDVFRHLTAQVRSNGKL